MSILSPDQWLALSPYLDEGLAKTDDERRVWLAQLRAENPQLAEHLEVLFRDYREITEEEFLERRVVPLPMTSGLAGQKIGVYTLISQIGQGGMGSVWLGERSDGRFQRRVAVKFLNVSLMGKSGEERFKREGRILGHLAHSHIAELIDAGVTQTGQPYLILEYVEGDQIDCYCDHLRLSIDARIHLFLDVLRAVAQAHANLVVHRDLKPSNVLVRNDGQVKLLDFGIAKLLEGDGQHVTTLTVAGGPALTPAYAAPEQLAGGAITTATDVYALGVLLYVLLTGFHPVGCEMHAAADLVKAIVDAEPQRLSDIVSDRKENALCARRNAIERSTSPSRLRRALCGDLDTIVAKALKKNPVERYASVTAFADDLRRYLKHEPISARPDSLAYRTGKFVRRHRRALALATLATIATVAGISGTLLQARKARMQRDFAFRQLARAESINDLDNFLLADAAPSGKPFTPNELLERAERIVQRQHGDPVTRAELLTSIGHKYIGQDEDGKARGILEQAYVISRGLSDVSVRAEASCALGAVLAHSELDRAESLVQQGLRELPNEPQYTLDRVSCLLSGSAVSREKDGTQEAVTRSLAARELLAASPLRSELMNLRVQLSLAESYRSAGQHRNAIAAFEKASSLMTALGRDETETAGTMFNNWALALHLAGRPLEAERLFHRAIDISRAGQTDEGVSPMLLLNYARTLREIGRQDEAAQFAERAYAKAEKAGHQVVMNQTLLVRARIYREQGHLDAAQAMLMEVEPRLRKALPPGHLAFAALATEYSMLREARGDLRGAMQSSNEALAICEAKGGDSANDYLSYALIPRSDIERQLGRLDNAARDATQAVAIQQHATEPGAFSTFLGHAYFAQGRAFEAQGKHDQARVAFQSAIDNLQTTLGPDHADTRAAQQMSSLSTLRQ